MQAEPARSRAERSPKRLGRSGGHWAISPYRIGSTLVEGSTLTDGNGRIGRVLLAYYLYRQQGVAFRFYARDRLEHLRAIEASDHGELGPLITFIGARIAP
jgi:hypothetical protein